MNAAYGRWSPPGSNPWCDNMGVAGTQACQIFQKSASICSLTTQKSRCTSLPLPISKKTTTPFSLNRKNPSGLTVLA